jgi:hypothetical protein
MLDLSRAVREQVVKETPPGKGAAPKTFTIRGLRHGATWGATAAGALLIAVISSRSEVGAQRFAGMFQADPQIAKRTFDAEAETRRLAAAVNGLATDGEQIKSRLAAVEHDMGDVTGTISKEIEEAKQAQRSEDGPSVSSTAAVTAAMPLPSPTRVVTPVPAATQTLADLPATTTQTRFGVDIGSGLTIQALRARWATLRTAHPALLEGLEPIVSVKEVPRANRAELRLVVGPLEEAAAATQLCSALTLFGLFCQPAIYDGQRLAQR